ncbi:MAG: hypothetical protein R6X25_13310 [Candidatus Krumholzibacteriia bacterium]
MPTFTTRAQQAFKDRAWPRYAAATGVALLLLTLLVMLGPDQESVRSRFEVYGAEGELRIMPDISIDEGRDAVHQERRRAREETPPAYEVVPDRVWEQAEREVPRVETRRDRPQESEVVAEAHDAAADDREQVELLLPQQTSPDYRIVKLVRPTYPVGATEAQQRIPRIRMVASLFVGPDGQVQAAMITQDEGGPVFEAELLRALRQWEFEWIVDPPPTLGRWITVPCNFKGPYAG